MSANRTNTKGKLSRLAAGIVALGCSFAASASVIKSDLISIGDSHVQSGSFATNNFGGSPQAFIKRDDNTNWTRKTYLAFDLGALPDGTFVDASLAFEFVDSGAGSTNAGTSWNFELFGLHDDTWAENSITWNDAPGNDTSGFGVIGAITTSLATFSLTGKGLGVQTFDNQALLDFLLAHGNNDLLSFILIRTSGVPGSQTYVHAIATKENTGDVLLPTLSVSVESVPIPATAVLLTLGLGGLVLRRRRSSRPDQLR